MSYTFWHNDPGALMDQMYDENPDYTWENAMEEIDLWFDAEKTNLDHDLGTPIVAIAEVQRWDGRHNAIKVLGNNLNECLLMAAGNDGWADLCLEGGELVSDQYGHDNPTIPTHVVFRKLKKGITPEEFEGAFLNGEAVGTPLWSEPLGPVVRKIYGFHMEETA